MAKAQPISTAIGTFESKSAAVDYIVKNNLHESKHSRRSFDSVPVHEIRAIIDRNTHTQETAPMNNVDDRISSIENSISQLTQVVSQLANQQQPTTTAPVTSAPAQAPVTSAPTPVVDNIELNKYNEFAKTDIGRVFASMHSRFVVFKPENKNGTPSGLMVSREGADPQGVPIYAIHKVFIGSDGNITARENKRGDTSEIMDTIVNGYRNGGKNPYKLDNETITAIRNTLRSGY